MDYKRILEGVVNIINTTEKSDIGFANICTYIGENCPELKESEDERIRKELIAFLKENLETGRADETWSMSGLERWIAWLEKQGEQKQELLTKEKALKNSPFVEQKPADKVEPKFKVGDWVVHDMSDGRVSPPTQIVDMTNKSYVFDTEQCFYFSDAEEIFRKWTIKDAKDGDVLAGADNIIIYGGYINNYGDRIGNKAILAYCGWNGEQLVINKKKKEGFGGIGYVPATKEQRDLLFTKMKEAGYEWDADKKELKEIEQKPVVIPKFRVGDFVKDANYHGEPTYEIVGMDGECYICQYRGNKSMGDRSVMHFCFDNPYLRLVEKKPVDLVAILKDYFANTPKEQQDKDWEELKYLNNFGLEVVELEPAWGEYDCMMIESIIQTLEITGDKGANRMKIDFLKSLKDRVQPQPKQEWSEEDEKEYRRVEYAIMKVFGGDAYLIGWIRKFKNMLLHQITWKPSDEQMKVLDVAIKSSHLTTAEYDGLVKLREQLKKL